MKTTKQLLKENKEIYRRLFEDSPDAIIIHDLENIYMANNAAIKFGKLTSVKELISLKVSNFLPRESLKTIKNKIEKYLEGNHIALDNQKIILKDGSEIYIEARGIRVEYNGMPAIQTSVRDVTERVLSENKLRESEERFRNVIEIATDIIFNTDLEGNITYVNPVFEAHSGYSLTELLGKDINILVDDSYKEKIKEIYFSFFKSSEKNMITTVSARTKSDEKIWLELNISKIHEGKFVVGFTAIARNITRRKETEMALAESEEKYRLLVENSTEMIYKTDLEGNYIFINQVFIEQSGLTEAEILKMNCFDRVVKEHQNEVQDFYKKQFKDKKKFSYYEFPSIIANNKFCWIGQTALLELNKRGDPKGYSITARDITEKHEAEEALKSSEERLSVAQEIAHIGHWQENHKTGELFFSDECKRILGFDTDIDIKKGQFWGIVHPEEVDEFKKLWVSLEKNMLTHVGKFRIVLKNGSIRHINERAHFKKDNKGNLSLTLGTVQDITSEMHTEKEIKTSREKIRELSLHLQSIQEEERAYLAREIHDELGQGLTGIKMDLSWLKQRIENGSPEINERIISLNNLIDQIIVSVRKISSELHPAILEDLGLRAAIEWQIEEFKKRSTINCELLLPEEKLGFDKNQARSIFRIIQESLTNILRHSKADNIKIAIQRINDNVLLTITDDGIGFDPLLNQIDRGFGLFGMKERAESLEAELTINSVPKEGTTITLHIPIYVETV